MQRKAGAALLAGLALVIGGCGGTGTTTVGRAEAVRRLEAACVAGGHAGRIAPGKHDAETVARAYQADLRTIADKLDHVEATGAAKADLDAYKAAAHTRLDAFKRILAAGTDDRQTIAAERPRIEAAGRAGFAAIRRLGARHVCI
jgi:hypothetical protein